MLRAQRPRAPRIAAPAVIDVHCVPTGDAALPAGTLRNQTLRQVVRPSIAGQRLRVRLSNFAGTRPLRIVGASIARADGSTSPAITPATVTALRFDGQAEVVIPAGADYLSDPLPFAVQALAVIRETGLDLERVNVNGGAVALGHPLGCTGAKLTATILREMERGNHQYGMVTMCIGGGQGAAGIFERM